MCIRDRLIRSRAWVDFSQGLDIRLVNRDNVSLLNRVRIKAVHLDGAQLAAFLSAYANGEIILPQQDTDYTDEQEETEDEA